MTGQSSADRRVVYRCYHGNHPGGEEGVWSPEAMQVEVATEDSSDVVSEAEGVEEGEELQESSVVRLREPRLDGDRVICGETTSSRHHR